MKLNCAQVERTLSQLQGKAIPDNHPVVPQLNNIFGEHTFFLDGNGLSIDQERPLSRAALRRSRGLGRCFLTIRWLVTHETHTRVRWEWVGFVRTTST
jgi:hypothetical protein